MNNAKGVFLQLPAVILLSTNQKQATRQKSSLFFVSDDNTSFPYFIPLFTFQLPCYNWVYIRIVKKSISWGDKIIVNTIDFHDNLTGTNALFRCFTLWLAWRHLGDTLETYRIYYCADIMSVSSPTVVFFIIMYYTIINIR